MKGWKGIIGAASCGLALLVGPGAALAAGPTTELESVGATGAKGNDASTQSAIGGLISRARARRGSPRIRGPRSGRAEI